MMLDCLSTWEKHKPKNELERLYSPDEMYTILGIGRTTENKLNRAGVLVPVWVGGRKKYTREAIENAMKEI